MYLIIVAMICSMIVCVLYTIDYVISLWRELGVLNVSWLVFLYFLFLLRFSYIIYFFLIARVGLCSFVMVS